VGRWLANLLPQLFVGGALFSLVTVLLNRKGDQRKLLAEAKKIEAEGDSALVLVAKEIVNELREELARVHGQVALLEERLRQANQECAALSQNFAKAEAELVAVRTKLAALQGGTGP
jgi:septal ring factor EnvC (AmiA/AmiB activator)